MQNTKKFKVDMLTKELYQYSAYVDPVWQGCEEEIEKDEVACFLRNEWFIDRSYNFVLAEGLSYLWDRDEHVSRIATLANQGWSDDIEIEVEATFSSDGEFSTELFIEGNHRLAAALFLDEETISTELSIIVYHPEESSMAELGEEWFEKAFRYQFPKSWRRYIKQSKDDIQI